MISYLESRVCINSDSNQKSCLYSIWYAKYWLVQTNVCWSSKNFERRQQDKIIKASFHKDRSLESPIQSFWPSHTEFQKHQWPTTKSMRLVWCHYGSCTNTEQSWAWLATLLTISSTAMNTRLVATTSLYRGTTLEWYIWVLVDTDLSETPDLICLN